MGKAVAAGGPPSWTRRQGLGAAAALLLGGPPQLARALGNATDAEPPDPLRPGRVLQFPRDHGAHPGSRIEWWYATSWLAEACRPGEPALGFQVTFFRNRTGLAEDLPGRLAPRQLLSAHAALTDLAARRHHHASRIARWSGREEPGLRHRAARHDTDVTLDGWFIRRRDGAGQDVRKDTRHSLYESRVAGDGFVLALELQATQPLLLQGDAGFSRKGPEPAQASRYVSEPQLAASGRVTMNGRTRTLAGRAWLDHEWSDELLHAQALGWDWVGCTCT